MNSTDNETAINFLTGPAVDTRTNTPAYKQTKVRMEVLEVDGENPMPKANPRNKKRHPQSGIEVHRKWARPGYVHLTDK
ncbi:formate dehydrogenase, alpha subunit domain protein [Bacillus anthracis]|nr:Formate dehydrogenase subunit alpha [Bacillus anthracis str. SVA11]AJG46644.1 formate dehydrogenase, alpha subunit domain protein [Bacillus anthracis str. Turkey32]AJG67588.1 formate dehydrogenase, alpha subunit domain protein [Bacillus anthracis]EJT20874.1 formate dehydrogenase subunit alpha [Bacillus anthracis str. UR-1]AJH56622.1 formate dehydrogenase, alpha subunit domain protein [Bacillus anthracis]